MLNPKNLKSMFTLTVVTAALCTAFISAVVGCKSLSRPASNLDSFRHRRAGTGSYADATVSLINTKDNGMCAGVLIAKNLMLTAGRCFTPEIENGRKLEDGTYVAFGEAPNFSHRLPIERVLVHSQKQTQDLESKIKQMFRQSYQNVSLIMDDLEKKEARGDYHDMAQLKKYRSLYDNFRQLKMLHFDEPVNDIAIVKFAGDPPATAKIASIANNYPQADRLIQVVGLRNVNETFTKAESGAARIDERLDLSKELLLKNDTLGKCFWLEGSPAFFTDDSSRLSVMGVYSRGEYVENCEGEKGVFTDFIRFRGWIDCQTAAIAGNNSQQCQPQDRNAIELIVPPSKDNGDGPVASTEQSQPSGPPASNGQSQQEAGELPQGKAEYLCAYPSNNSKICLRRVREDWKQSKLVFEYHFKDATRNIHEFRYIPLLKEPMLSQFMANGILYVGVADLKGIASFTNRQPIAFIIDHQNMKARVKYLYQNSTWVNFTWTANDPVENQDRNNEIGVQLEMLDLNEMVRAVSAQKNQ